MMLIKFMEIVSSDRFACMKHDVMTQLLKKHSYMVNDTVSSMMTFKNIEVGLRIL